MRHRTYLKNKITKKIITLNFNCNKHFWKNIYGENKQRSLNFVVKIDKIFETWKKYIIIKICSKYDNTTNMTAFPIMHCVLFAANELNNAPNSSRRVGVEVAFFPRASTGDVWLAAYFPTARWTCLPCSHRRSPYISVTTCFLHCRTLSRRCMLLNGRR